MTDRRGRAARLGVYVVSALLHGGLWQGVRAVDAPPPPPLPPVKIVMREVPPEPEPPPPPPEPEEAPEAPPPPADTPPPAAPEPPPPTPAPRVKKARPEPAEPAPASPPAAPAAPDFGLQLGNAGAGPGGVAVPAGDPGGAPGGAGGRERVEKQARRLDAKPKPAAAGCDEAEVRPAPLELPQPQYTDAARAAGVEGKVRVQLAISATGEVTDVKVVSSLHPDLDAAAGKAMKTAKFSPATRCGKPVATTLTIGVKFSL